MTSETDLRDEIIRLGPWHLEVEVTPGLTTRSFLDAPEGTYAHSKAAESVSFLSPRDPWMELVRRVYPDGLEGRTFLDCACNCGGYSFWAKELGARECFGFDVREHWIAQAQFLADHRESSSDGVTFEVLDLYDLPRGKTFNVVMFQGIFYHLPDPITGLKLAADSCSELLIFDTESRLDLPDGMLAVSLESTELVMSGVHSLSWFPTGTGVLNQILEWLGFVETRILKSRPTSDKFGRIQILASRQHGLLNDFEA